jgi:hypothetical protein
MKNPTSKQFKTVINTFIKILPIARFKGHLDMGQGDIEKNICGTPMCHGGWYAVAANVKPDNFGIVDFDDGALALAKTLGFIDKHALKDWALNNPNLWGNPYGNNMFCSISAFNDAKTMRGVINHWIGVHNRTCPKSKPIDKIN